MEGIVVRDLVPYLFFVLTIVAFFLNMLGLMKLIPLFITLPVLFISTYMTLFSFTHRRTFRGRMQ